MRPRNVGSEGGACINEQDEGRDVESVEEGPAKDICNGYEEGGFPVIFDDIIFEELEGKKEEGNDGLGIDAGVGCAA